MGTRRLGHWPALDGLRGFAILFVLVQHAGMPMTGLWGATGVTVFFVLSGFLITTQLVQHRERDGRVDFRGFYARRVRRWRLRF
ncbi:hypothetical protein ASG78_04320 [Nostocoides sp. Soil756]|nr:acyltransferase family protein [Tetrasphaera sp. Soil756]KRE62280.1 hypothetical protein ASG78_04320 [Tetrasphaera sp. Soil756]